MVQIRPFVGLRYDSTKIPDTTEVVAPPYDVIAPQYQSELYEKSLYNVVRLILGKKLPTEDAGQVYQRAKETLEQWMQEGVLKPESQPVMYAYTQTWESVERRGFIALLQLADYDSGQVLPHEYTLGGPKADRLALMKATGTVLSPIFGLYHDSSKTVERFLFQDEPSVPVVDIVDQDGVRHQFWPVSDPAIIQSISEVLAKQSVLIADGHHRYETALAYQDWRRNQEHQESAEHGSLPWDYTMMFLTNMADSGLRIYPTHRVFNRFPAGWDAEKLLNALEASFEPAADDSQALFWVQTGKSSKTGYQLKVGVDLTQIPEPLRHLDVAILDQLVFQAILKQSANDLKQEGFLQFIRDEAEIHEVLQHAETLVFWVHAPSVNEVQTICESGYRMPQKSTYFYPKLLSGLVMYHYACQLPFSKDPVALSTSMT